MKLLIAADMEGITGVIHWNHIDPDHPEYQRFRHIMTADVNAAVEGAVDAKVDEIIVSDGHWSGSNILIEELNSHARLNCGSPSPLSMVEGIDQGIDAAFFIGYHARIGTQNAILDHTWSSASVSNVWLNNRLVGEIGLNAGVCGQFNVPVLMLSGDQAAMAEARDWLGNVETVVVKQAKGRWAAECLPPATTSAMIRQKAFLALQRFRIGNSIAPLKISSPVTLTIEFMYSHMADRACVLPGCDRLDARRISYIAPDMVITYQVFQSLVGLAGK